MLRILFILFVLLPYCCAFAAGDQDDEACLRDLTKVELTFDRVSSSVKAIGVPHYISSQKSFSITLLDKPFSFDIPVLRGFRNTGVEVKRIGRLLGTVGKTNRGRHVLLEPFKEEPAEYRTLYCMMKLVEAGVGVPVFGITMIAGKMYVVRPLIKGYAPMAIWGSLYNNSSFNQILDLEKMEQVLLKIYPGYVRWGLVKDARWTTLTRDSDFENETLDLQFSVFLNEFLEQIKFVATEDGHLLIEQLPTIVTKFTIGLPYNIGLDEAGNSWRFQRWNWYRYMLAAQLADDERPKFVEWLKNKEQVEWMMRFQFINKIVTNSPAFPGRRNRMTGPPFGMIEDKVAPFRRPTANLKFKNNGALKYHFQKHGALMNYGDEAAYLQGAKDFVLAPPLDDRLYYVRQSGDIVLAEWDGSRMAVFSPSGQLRTYMQPSVEFHDHNHNNYYFYEQILKDLDFL
jgi:hypothetical protein